MEKLKNNTLKLVGKIKFAFRSDDDSEDEKVLERQRIRLQQLHSFRDNKQSAVPTATSTDDDRTCSACSSTYAHEQFKKRVGLDHILVRGNTDDRYSSSEVVDNNAVEGDRARDFVCRERFLRPSMDRLESISIIDNQQPSKKSDVSKLGDRLNNYSRTDSWDRRKLDEGNRNSLSPRNHHYPAVTTTSTTEFLDRQLGRDGKSPSSSEDNDYSTTTATSTTDRRIISGGGNNKLRKFDEEQPLISEEAVRSCLKRMRKMCPDFMFAYTDVSAAILECSPEGVADILRALKVKKYKIVFFLIEKPNDSYRAREQRPTRGCRKSLLVYYRYWNAFFHYDSPQSYSSDRINYDLARSIVIKCERYLKTKSLTRVVIYDSSESLKKTVVVVPDDNVSAIENITKLIYLYDRKGFRSATIPLQINGLKTDGGPDVIRTFIRDQYIVEKLCERYF